MKRSLTLALLMSIAALPALANDTTAQLATGGLEFTRTDAISMEEEKLYISPKEVRVDYIFRNTGDLPVETYVAFPMPDIDGGPESNVDAGDLASDNFLGFSVVQDGVAIKPDLQQRVYSSDIDMTDVVAAAKIPMNPLSEQARKALAKLPQETLDDWQNRGLIFADVYDDGSGEKKEYVPLWTLKSAYWWKTSFAPGKDIQVAHTYRPSVGGTVATTFLDENNEAKGARFDEYKKKYCIDDAFVRLAKKSNEAMNANQPSLVENWISYVLTTGGNWAGPIKKFTLVIDKGEHDNFVSFCGEGVKKTGDTTFEMTATDYYPEKDLDILLLVPTGAP
ncbi:DUF4424 domain-containing protein [Rhizobium sp. KVB221]|uniref:DUF4424 domain-containing protein n=1 Tax=Rhizobium setariae TaxID=2801340 RepID=A0A936YR32_9HYPH|nr:DUF4424 domain-containing protein [Rhizobium setariae]MBL0370800.1 DUF4424 domain-containing protein [Rhizobium setariae]